MPPVLYAACVVSGFCIALFIVGVTQAIVLRMRGLPEPDAVRPETFAYAIALTPFTSGAVILAMLL